MFKYLLNNLAIVSHLLNTITGGKHDHSFSARVGYASFVLEKKWAKVAEKIINPPFALAGHSDHCYREFIRFKNGVNF